MMGIAVPEWVLRDFLRRARGFFEQRRPVLRIVLIFEAADEILHWELIGGLGLVTQQVADCVVVLAVRQPAEHGSRPPFRVGPA